MEEEAGSNLPSSLIIAELLSPWAKFAPYSEGPWTPVLRTRRMNGCEGSAPFPVQFRDIRGQRISFYVSALNGRQSAKTAYSQKKNFVIFDSVPIASERA
uniref:Uncharacterized protein n=1 Tax=Steinernema glaseri TaxID=37863 RepID=A0A1I7ZW52_9BILA